MARFFLGSGRDLVRRHQLLGPARSWYCINRFGRWESLPTAQKVEEGDEAPTLTTSQLTTLVADSEPDEILAALKPDFVEPVRDALLSWRFLQAQQALAAADALAKNSRRKGSIRAISSSLPSLSRPRRLSGSNSTARPAGFRR
ncbi:hypothetical protein [Azoarcus sp. KH32C]|uniref:hypothetical protein n=1 Tax=Azoarcus sp. KH32C TaxID=748247 RepID=UPI0005A0F1DE|nr:hypothetical protein [Azoarcus sp. KH32C]